ncbi:MAG: heparinase II/III family protein [Phycisphaerae bacterium]|nr:heparinase II/III family protein [Phycisphaerae bacterium]MDW8261531.1 alginate lyase family protein [Phycisphaerales bacterium]
MSPRPRPLFELSPLESRVLLTSTPASPRPETLGALLDRGERQWIVDRFTHNPQRQAILQARLNTSPGQFDSNLLSYMQGRTNAKWYFDDSVTADYVSYLLGSSINYQVTVDRASEVKEFHRFPEQGSSTSYEVDLPDVINWVAPGGSSNPEFLHTLNRHPFFQDLAYAYRITGDAEYAQELAYELASWSQQYVSSDVPGAWSDSDKAGWRLDTALRAENWVNTYFLMLGGPHFTAAASTLMIYKLIQKADYLYSLALSATPADFSSNRTLAIARSLLMLGQMFPEIDNSPMWESVGRNLLFQCARGQLYNDGSHHEQSPSYTNAVADDLLEARLLDKINGDDGPWRVDPDGSGPARKMATIVSNAVSSYWQLLSPDGNRPAIGDTYRNTSVTLFLKANLIQGTSLWPAAKPRLRDVFLFGPDAINPFVGNPVTPPLGNRGQAYAMTDGGLYVMRSDNSANATQVIFDASPKGGLHGHFDLFNFELFGGGRPLILDPGAYIYEPENPDRQYVVSTRAHNTLNVDGANVGELEGSGNPGIIVHSYSSSSTATMITASHFGYAHLRGNPVVTRTLWYNHGGIVLLVDRVEATTLHNYQISFNLDASAAASTTGVQTDNSFRTRFASGGNVKVAPIHTDGGSVVRGPVTFVTNRAEGDFKDDAYRFTVTRNNAKSTVFVTLITTYIGASVPNVTASLLTPAPTASGTVRVRLNNNGVETELTFTAPVFQRLNANAQSNGTFNDIAYDSLGRLHMVFSDRNDRKLKYTVRETDGTWSLVQTIADPVSASAGEYQYLSLAIDHQNRPAVAYFNGWAGDLMFARLSSTTNAFEVETVDSSGSTGLYPSLVFGRNKSPAITYYSRSKGDLRMAHAGTDGWILSTLDSAGDVGRFSSLVLDPTRPTATKWAVAYEDTTNGRVKYAIQGNIGPGSKANGYTYYTVDDMEVCGGYISLAFFKSGSSDPTRAYLPAVSYYDAGNASLKFAYAADVNYNFTAVTLARRKQGLYSRLFFSGPAENAINIFFFDRTNNLARRFSGILNWSSGTISNGGLSNLVAGGREIHVGRFNGNLAYSSLNETTGTLRVEFL